MASGLAGHQGPPLEIHWSPQTRRKATEQCGRALAQRAPRLFRRGKALAILDSPDKTENDGNDDLAAAGRTYVTVDVTLMRARIARSSDLKRQVDEAGIQFTGAPRGAPRRDGTVARVPIHPPMDPLKSAVAERYLCPARPLIGIAHVPYMDAPGRLSSSAVIVHSLEYFHDLSGLDPA